MQLPEEFKIRMKNILGAEYDKFVMSLVEEPACSGMRINLLKRGARAAVESCVGHPEQVPWCKNGYYAEKSVLSGKHPYHMCGLVYFQEPSAMSAAEALDIKPGDFVLDLCAAPGGKATQAAEKLQGKGLLVANEIIPKRAKILAENIGRMGITNAVVTNENPEKLAEKYADFFDKIIVDAPCSGEGMFRKEPQAVTEWSAAHTESCAARQKKILHSAFKMLKKGGKLVYSTCTFAPCENEGVAGWVLDTYPGIEPVNITLPGMTDANAAWAEVNHDLSGAKRIFPHNARGEGCFNALFQKNYGSVKKYEKNYKSVNKAAFELFEKQYLNTHFSGSFADFGDKLYLLPHNLDIDKIKTELAGLFLGTCKKGRFEPSHELCLALTAEDFKNTREIAEPAKYYGGETFPSDKKGWTAVLYGGFPLGWGKASDGILKNHFPKYLRF